MTGRGHLKNTKQFRSLKEKVDIIQYYEKISNEKNSKTKTLAHFHIKSLSSLNRILSNKNSIIKAHDEGKATKCRKTLKKGHFDTLDQQVNSWIEVMRAQNIEISADDIIEKANNLIPKDSAMPQKLSSGWFRGFKDRFGLKRTKFHGEAKSVDNNITEDWKLHLKSILKSWEPGNVFNLDESALFYQKRRRIIVLFEIL